MTCPVRARPVLIGLLIVTTAALPAAAAAQAADRSAMPVNPTSAAVREKAVFAVSDDDSRKWSLTLGNIGNALDALGADGAELELVAYGPGIAMLKKDSPVAERIAQAIARGVRVVACQHSMHGAHLTLDDLVPGVTPVPSGVVELMKRQHDGYAYIRS